MNTKHQLTLLGVLTAVLTIAILAVVPTPLKPVAVALMGNPEALGVGAITIAALSSVALDLSNAPLPPETIRREWNRQRALDYYRSRNGLIPHTVATLPVMAIATTKDLVKSTNACVTKHAGVLGNAVAAADDAWALTGAAIANATGAPLFVRYLLLVNASDTKTVQRSSQAATKAACVFDALPADGLAIMGILTVEIANGTTFTPDTTLLDAAGITATFIDGDQDDAVDALGGRLVTA